MEKEILTLVTFFPLVGVILLMILPKDRIDSIKGFALIVSFVTLLFSTWLYWMFDPLANGMQMEINIPWVVSMGISYHMGIDGISL